MVSANFIFQNDYYDENNQLLGIETQVPFFDLNWNSEANRLNTFQILTGYSFSSQQRDLGYGVTGSLIYIPQGINSVIPDSSNGEFLGLINGSISTSSGFTFKTNLEIGEEIFADLEATHKILDDLSIGLYYRNFNTTNIGLNSRESDDSFGGIFRYESILDGLYIEAQLGDTNDGFDFQLKSEVRFNF